MRIKTLNPIVIFLSFCGPLLHAIESPFKLRRLIKLNYLHEVPEELVGCIAQQSHIHSFKILSLLARTNKYMQQRCYALMKQQLVKLIQNQKPDQILLWTIKYGTMHMVRQLLKRGEINVNAKVVKERVRYFMALKIVTPLLSALERKNLEMFKLLINHPDIELNKSVAGLTLIGRLIQYDLVDWVELLLTKNVDLDKESGLGGTPLIAAIKCNNHRIVDLLLQDSRVDVNYIHPNFGCWGISPLMAAIQSSRKKIVKLLCSFPGTNVNMPHNFKGNTPLMLAVKQCGERENNLSIIKILLKHPQINVNEKNHHGLTALMIASLVGYEKKYAVLKEYSDPNILSRDHKKAEDLKGQWFQYHANF